MGLFHSGVTWRALGCLVDASVAVTVDTAPRLHIAGRNYLPDLLVRCRRTYKIMLVVEVWHTHKVSPKKKAAFVAAALPWIEVRSWHVISRTRKRPLPVLDWGGSMLPEPPRQLQLFDDGLCSEARINVHLPSDAVSAGMREACQQGLRLEHAGWRNFAESAQQKAGIPKLPRRSE